MAKTVLHIGGEAAFVGAFLIVFFYAVRYIDVKRIIPSCTPEQCLMIELFVAGFVFHVVFEYTGLNKWYSFDYVERLRQ